MIHGKDEYVCSYALNNDRYSYYKDCIEVLLCHILLVDEEHLHT